MPPRDSDRYVTPRVVVAGMFLATILVLAVVAAVTYLTARGLDPDPMLRLSANVATAVGSLGTLLLQLTGRKTIAKVERETGRLGSGVVQVVDQLEAERQTVDQLRLEAVVPIDPETRPHPLYGGLPYPPGRDAAPGLDGR